MALIKPHMYKALDKLVKKVDDKRKGPAEEWPQLPDESWKWKLSPAAKELERELNILIQRFLLFRNDVEEETGETIPMPTPEMYFDEYEELKKEGIRVAILINAKTNESRKDFIKREMHRFSRLMRVHVWQYLQKNRDVISMQEYAACLSIYPEAFGRKMDPETTQRQMDIEKARCYQFDDKPGSARFLISDIMD